MFESEDISLKRYHLKFFFRDFVICGTIGLLIEITFTALESMRRQDYRLKGTTSLLMFPIYGLAAFLRPIYRKIKHHNFVYRGLVYMFVIYGVEFFNGIMLKKIEKN